MEISNKGILEIAYREGMSLSKYLDTQGVWTIGIGATASEIPDLALWPYDKSLLIPDIISMFTKSLDKYARAVNDALYVNIEQYQFDALVSICYNIGTGGLKNSTFMKRINAKSNLKDIASAIMSWTKNPELIGRRTGEMKLYTQGIYINDGTVNAFPVSPTTHKPIYSKGRSLDLKPYLLDKIEDLVVIPTDASTDTLASKEDKNFWKWLRLGLLGF